MNTENVDKAIELLEALDPNDLGRPGLTIESPGKYCPAGYLAVAFKMPGFPPPEGVDVSSFQVINFLYDKIFGTGGSEPGEYSIVGAYDSAGGKKEGLKAAIQNLRNFRQWGGDQDQGGHVVSETQ